jgi:hypothetical protein
VLIACEFSGTVRDAFLKAGHEAMSCDLEPTMVPGPHYQGNVLDILDDGWDLMICHPPCTYLTVTGNKWMKPEYSDRFPDRPRQREEAVDFFKTLYEANIPKIAVENPVGIMSSILRKPDQIIQPYQFGHSASKKTCLWLKNLPLLTPTNIVDKGEFVTYKSGKKMAKWYADAASNSPEERAKIRNRTFLGIAEAMANQWG